MDELLGPTVGLFAAFPKENDKCPTLVTLPSLKANLLKIKEDIDPQSRMVGGTNLPPNNKKSVIFHFFAELYLSSFK